MGLSRILFAIEKLSNVHLDFTQASLISVDDFLTLLESLKGSE